MIKSPIPFDVTEYEEQFFFGLTSRQIKSLVMCLLLGTPTFLIGSKFIEDALPLIMLVGIVIIPFGAYGFYKPQDMFFEDYAAVVLRFEFNKQIRTMEYLPNELVVHDEIRKVLLDAEILSRANEIKADKAAAKIAAKNARKASKLEKKKMKAEKGK